MIHMFLNVAFGGCEAVPRRVLPPEEQDNKLNYL